MANRAASRRAKREYHVSSDPDYRDIIEDLLVSFLQLEPVYHAFSQGIQAFSVLLLYAFYLRFLSGLRPVKGAIFNMDDLPPNPYMVTDSYRDGFYIEWGLLLDLYLGYVIIKLYIWPIYNAFQRRMSLPWSLLSCTLNWGVAVLVYTFFNWLRQRYYGYPMIVVDM
ncbi:hypothetical protein F4808DRAFT_463972 [Astrocystis sublimbata]|nr:hypothetical protein F4808DRAFT_463972 [Astrocystis sublimbata]